MKVENYHCGHCKCFRVDADTNKSFCKRVDHKIIKFAHPWFKTYDCNQFSGVICSDFEPDSMYKYACTNWKGFDSYWKNYVKQWLPYGNTNITVGFIINNDTSVRYRVKLLDYVYGTIFEGNILKAIEKEYYIRKNKTDKIPTGRVLIHEKINGVALGSYLQNTSKKHIEHNNCVRFLNGQGEFVFN